MATGMTWLAHRYRLLDTLGAGGMGVVWLARDEMLGRDVAVKEVRFTSNLPESARAELRERTLREARAAAGLAHPAIVAVHDVIDQDERPWIVMDLVSGRSMEQVVRHGGPLPARRVAAVGVGVLDALSLAHGRGVLHRDVKPANIMLADDGRALLTDFGIAVQEGDPAITSSDQLVGSPGYMAPERLRGEGDGPSADLWSLAAALFAAVEGRGPFQRDTPMAALGAVLTQSPPYPERAGDLAPVLLAMLAKDPRERLSAAAFRAALDRAARGLPAEAEPYAPPRTPGTPPTRRRLGPLLAGGAALAVAGGTAAAVLLTREPPAASAPAASPSAVPASAAGRFPTPSEPCGLLDTAQARTVAPGAEAEDGEGATDKRPYCLWSAATGTRKLRVKVDHHAAARGRTAPEMAQAFFAQSRRQVTGDVGAGMFGETLPIRDVGRLGEESFAFDVRGTMGTSSHVAFRSSNVIIEVEVSEDDKRPLARMRDDAVRMARAVARRLDARG
ncbi:Serine/threonine protein kinase [Sinosporangium album]|uniref:non-specific serine/threonine protein kinase n=1 Tax=Sinosporangium album TaxID=504805 RepID=A0A1G7VSQ3_9ACTN|nr:serine/threonine-protein kinase [Sinosporangium album]SDG62835.1 Serine/threonine protein kinase [Sinosporangium album]